MQDPFSSITRDLRADPTVFALCRLPPHSGHSFRFADGRGCALSLDGQWEFRFSFRDGTPFGPWQTITVPGHIQMQGGPDYPYGTPQYVNTQYPWDGLEAIRPGQIPAQYDPVGEYRRRFVLPAQWQNCFIRLEGADAAAALACNGRLVGYSESSFDPAEFDLTPYLQPGENELLIRVYRFCSGSWLEDQDFWRMSGLFRPVTLFTKPTAHLEDVRITMEFAPGFTAATVRAALRPLPGAAGMVCGTLSGLEAQALLQGDQTVTLEWQLDRPHLWSAEDPYLYPLTLRTADETVTIQVGLREFCLRDGLLTLNGKRIVFKGVNRHEWSAEHGRAVTYQETEWDIINLKRHNVNGIRTSHYPNRSFLYDLCDRYGLYVIDETNLETHGTWQKLGADRPDEYTLPGSLPQWRQAVLARAAAMLERDKNHPCVLLWSCGNESFGGDNLVAIHDYFHAADPSRPVHYEGVFHDRAHHRASDVESQMYTPAADVERFIAQHPEKPFIMCEYAHAMGNSCGCIEDYTQLAYRQPRYQGGFIWEYMDHSLWQALPNGSRLTYGGDFGDRPTDYEFCADGLITATRQNTAKMQAVKAAYQDFVLKADSQGLHITNQSLFTDLAEYSVQCTLCKEGAPIARETLKVPLAPGQEVTLPLPFAIPADPALFTLDVAVLLEQDTLWGQQGDVVAVGQGVWDQTVPQPQPLAPASAWVTGDYNYGVSGPGWRYLISRTTGRLVSIRLDGKELLKEPAQLSLWRAPTCNDSGAGFGFRFARWAQAGRYAAPLVIEQCPEGLHVRYQLATDSHEEVDALWQFSAQGRCTLTLRWEGPEAEVPEFGLLLPLVKGYGQVSYFGRGPAETMPDRETGALLGNWQYAIAHQADQYMVPQDYGARTGVRQAELSGADLPPIRFGHTAGMVFCANGHTPYELENARHQDELPPVYETVVRCLAGVRGAGGDDSWGALPHPEHRYRLHPGDAFTFTFGR